MSFPIDHPSGRGTGSGTACTGVTGYGHFPQLSRHFLVSVQFLDGKGVLELGDDDSHGEGEDYDSK